MAGDGGLGLGAFAFFTVPPFFSLCPDFFLTVTAGEGAPRDGPVPPPAIPAVTIREKGERGEGGGEGEAEDRFWGRLRGAADEEEDEEDDEEDDEEE